MTLWREVSLVDLCERVTVGHVGKMADRYVDDGVPFLRSQNVKPFVIETDGMLRIDEAFHRKLAKSSLSEGDVVVVHWLPRYRCGGSSRARRLQLRRPRRDHTREGSQPAPLGRRIQFRLGPLDCGWLPRRRSAAALQ